MTCHNCNALNPAGVTHCQSCRMPGDFGRVPVVEAPVIQPKLVACGNCGGQAPVHAEKCPSCRWPLPIPKPALKTTRVPPLRQAAPSPVGMTIG